MNHFKNKKSLYFNGRLQPLAPFYDAFAHILIFYLNFFRHTNFSISILNGLKKFALTRSSSTHLNRIAAPICLLFKPVINRHFQPTQGFFYLFESMRICQTSNRELQLVNISHLTNGLGASSSNILPKLPSFCSSP